MGQQAVESIECDHDRHKWTIDECKTIKEVFRKKLKELQSDS
ncbi:TPA: recombination protein NinG [Providencia alcalifaciens]